MQWVATAAEARAARRWVEVPNEGGAFLRDYFGRATAAAFTGGTPPVHAMPCPQAFLVEQNPNQVARPHFHLVDQFQVVVAGAGLLGKRPVGGIGVHYANAHTPYGPIEAGPNGLHYLTLRNRWDTTRAHMMPESRAEQAKTPRRHLLVETFDPCDETSLAAVMQPGCRALHGPDEDGLAVWLHRLGPGQSVTGADPRTGGGQYWLVLAGAMLADGRDLDPRSCLYLSPDETALAIRAGEAGLEVLGLQFPTMGGVVELLKGD
jgi:hypothetical protein